jgi:hypothetical protein
MNIKSITDLGFVTRFESKNRNVPARNHPYPPHVS